LILLPPATLLGLTSDQLEAVLAHELAHVRRFDYLINLFQMLVETLLFYHPAVWWISARIRHERELCCDDLAIQSCGDAFRYARALTRLERLRLTTPTPVMGSSGGSLRLRIHRIVGLKTQECGPSKLSAVLALSLGLMCFGLTIHWANGQAQQKPVPETVLTDPAPRPAAEPAAPNLTRNPIAVTEPNRQERSAPAAFRSLAVAELIAFEPGVQVDTPGAQLLHRTPVRYPRAAMIKRIEGVVMVEATLDATGNVTDARVLSGPEELRKAALVSVLDWHFVNSNPGSTQQVNITFRLPEASVNDTRQAELAADELKARALASVQEAEMRAQVEKLRQSFRETQQGVAGRSGGPVPAGRSGGGRGPANLIGELAAGKTLRSITINGIDEPLQSELLSRLPVHEGDILSAQSIEAAAAAVRQFDEHVLTRFIPRDGQVDLILSSPR
jgi:TonB family protein